MPTRLLAETRWSLQCQAAVLLLATLLFTACESNNNAPDPSPGTGTGETITGRERIGWDQAAASAAELSTFRYAIYVDGNRSEVADVTCASSAGASGFACSGRLPSMTTGSHVLELAVFTTSSGIVESARSAPLRVTVTGATASSENALTNGERIKTKDGVQLEASLITDGLSDITDAALAADGRLAIAERGGQISIHSLGVDGSTAAVGMVAGELLALALSPDFSTTGRLFVVQVQDGVFHLARYRLFEGQLIERMMVIPGIPASQDRAARLRFGPDGKLYAAFDDAGDRSAALKLFEWSGKILRLNPDGSTPEDQPAASPVFWSGMASPGGLDWPRNGRATWVAETGTDGVERLRALFTAGERPRRPGVGSSYVLPPPVGATSLAFYRGEEARALRNDLFIAARKGGYLLRVSFDERDPLRAIATEKLLEGRLGEVRAVVATADGALFVANGTAVWRLKPVSMARAADNPH